MLELSADLLPLLRAGESVAVVTVSRVMRSAPRGIGAALAVTAAGRVIGSISGGCVEGDAVMLATAALATGDGARARFGFDDETAHAAGLACGGTVDVVCSVIGPADDDVISVLTDAAAGRAASIGILTAGNDSGRVVPVRMLGDAAIDAVRTRESRAITSPAGEALIVSVAPPPRLIVVGAGEHAAALCRVAAAAGWAVTVCDAWELLVTRERFPDAAELVAAFPHDYLAGLEPDAVDARTAVCVLTHDERLDVPALAQALAMPVGFVGAMGARSTVARRRELLDERGVADADIARIHSPLGLDLGGSSPEETAISVLAEIVAARHEATGRPLHATQGPVHRAQDAAVATGSAASCALASAPGMTGATRDAARG